jgi:hypothetical protein
VSDQYGGVGRGVSDQYWGWDEACPISTGGGGGAVPWRRRCTRSSGGDPHTQAARTAHRSSGTCGASRSRGTPSRTKLLASSPHQLSGGTVPIRSPPPPFRSPYTSPYRTWLSWQKATKPPHPFLSPTHPPTVPTRGSLAGSCRPTAMHPGAPHAHRAPLFVRSQQHATKPRSADGLRPDNESLRASLCRPTAMHPGGWRLAALREAILCLGMLKS